MPHQCVHCSKLYENAAPELLSGCSCGSRFFFYIKDEQFEKLNKEKQTPIVLDIVDKKQVEQDVREMIGIKEQEPVILDFESVRITGPGKFQLDVVNLFAKKRPLIYKLEEGKYIIDLASSMKVNTDYVKKKMKKAK